MINQIKKSWLVVVLLVVVTIIGFKLVNNKPVEKIATELPKIKLAYNINSLDTVPLIIALQKGYFKENGIEVDLTQVTGSDGAVAASSGQVDMVIVSAPRLYGPIDKGAPIKMLSPMSNTNSEVFVRPNSNIKTLKDLEGKKVSFGPAGGAKELFFKSILKNENVDIKKINFITVDNTYLPVALMDKKAVDVVLISDANYVDQAQKLGATILPEWQTKGYRKVSTGLVVAANADFLNNHSTNVESFFKAIVKANGYLKSNIDDSANISAQFFKDNTNGSMVVDPNNFKELVSSGRVTYDLWENTAPIIQMAGVSYELGQTKRSLTLNDLYDLRFKDLLESAQNEIYGSIKN